MTELPTHLVIRRRAPLRALMVASAVSVLAVVGAYAIYELGRYDAGYDAISVSQQRAELEVKIERLEASNRQLHSQLAELETVRIGRGQERAELARTIGDLEAQVARQSQELAFYRSVVAQQVSSSGADGDVKIEQVSITALPQPQHFRVHVALIQVAHPEGSVSGSISLSVQGLPVAPGPPATALPTAAPGSAAGAPNPGTASNVAGTAANAGAPPNGAGTAPSAAPVAASALAITLDFAAIAGAKEPHAFSFRYFQHFDQDVTLPVGFRPEHLGVEVRSTRKSAEPLAQTFTWRIDPS